MKNMILMFIAMIAFISCNKDDKVIEPALADQVAGRYTVSMFDLDGFKVSLPNKNLAGEEISANITVFRKSETQVDMAFNLITKKSNGNSETITNKFEALSLKTSTTNGIEIYDGATKVGNILNKVLSLNLQDNQSKFIIQGKKDGV